MNDKQKVSAILSVILTAAIALLAVFGYNVAIVQPQVATLEAGQVVAGTTALIVQAPDGVQVCIGGAGVEVLPFAGDAGN